ncbi:hypothetical protein [Deinococcus sp.]|uniref:TapB family protein n=1 Tax=Deinococcus sp. TaxID=47478 RepID=UPI00391A37C9
MTASSHLSRVLLTAGFMGTLLGSAAQAACSSPYYPVREGLTRTYRGTVEGRAISYTEKISGVSARGFTVTTTVNELPPTKATYKCRPSGVISSPSISNAAMKVTSIKQTGVTQPPTLRVGTSWNSGLVLDATSQGQKVHNETSIAMKVVAAERITTKLVTFPALKVTASTTIRMSVGGQTMNPLVSQSTSWLVKDIGVVKSVLPNGTIELVSFK